MFGVFEKENTMKTTEYIDKKTMNKIYKQFLAVKGAVKLPDLDIGGQCMFDTVIAKRLLEDYDIFTTIQAGNASWEVVDLAHDDGYSPTHYAYMWNTPRNDGVVQMPWNIPECHIWLKQNYKPDKVIDFSIYELDTLVPKMGMTWQTNNKPNDYIWGRPKKYWRYENKSDCLKYLQPHIEKAKEYLEKELIRKK